VLHCRVLRSLCCVVCPLWRLTSSTDLLLAVSCAVHHCHCTLHSICATQVPEAAPAADAPRTSKRRTAATRAGQSDDDDSEAEEEEPGEQQQEQQETATGSAAAAAAATAKQPASSTTTLGAEEGGAEGALPPVHRATPPPFVAFIPAQSCAVRGAYEAH
jgi:hypothetical protein